jgi:hypothetical protein
MTLNVTGLLVIPKEPGIIVYPQENGRQTIYFTGLTWPSPNPKEEHYKWTCLVSVAATELDKWQNEYLQPGGVLYLSHASMIAPLDKNGKYHNPKLRLDPFNTKKLSKAAWIKEERKDNE